MNRKKRLFSNRILLELILWFRVLLVKILIRRSQPDFMIIGAQKCGTTSLFNYICQYSTNFKPPLVKETQFFTQNYAKGLDYYYAHFPLFKSPTQITGEASPTYLFFKKAAKRTHLHFPQLKLVVLLRDPVDRAYSHYWHERRHGHETLSFLDALMHEEDRVSIDPRRYSYKYRGCYVKHLKEWYNAFQKGQIFVLFSGELYSRPRAILMHVLAFLDLQTRGLCTEVNLNYPRPDKENGMHDYQDMSDTERRYLEIYFEQWNRDLSSFLGRDLPW